MLAAQLFIAGIGLTAAGLLYFFVVQPIVGAIVDWWRGYTYVAPPPQHESGTLAGTPDRNARNAPTEPPAGNHVPINRSALFARILSSLPEDEVIDILAQMTAPDGSWRYAESRIGKFAPGRLEDRIDQVRAIRGTPPQPKPPGRELVVRDKAGERRIPFDEVAV